MLISKCFQLSVWYEGIIQVQNTLNKLSVWSCCSPLYWHWPMGGTAQMQRAGAVGGRLNWSNTVLDRAGSITVISLQEAGPETTHTEHWQRRTDMEFGKMCGVKQHVHGRVLVILGWHCTWWLEYDCSCYLTRIMTDLLWPLLRSQGWLQPHSSAEEKNKLGPTFKCSGGMM